MDLIEVLWKQDADLGFSMDFFETKPMGDKQGTLLEDESGDEIFKLKALAALKKDSKLDSVKVRDHFFVSSNSVLLPTELELIFLIYIYI